MNDEAKNSDVDAISSDERTWAMLAHLSILVLGVIGPLVIWLVKKEESKFVADQAMEALNFHIAVLIATVVLACTVVGPVVVAIGAVVYGIIAGLEANKGVYYRYPYTLRLIK
ncbi:MAG: DUF4870 domain-containing protein [Pirellulaceae bacterium]